MISIETRAVAAMLAAAALAGPALAGPLVVRALGPSAAAFKPGQRLPDNAPLVLRAGDQVTILDARGTRSFTGPGNYRFDSASAAAAPTAFTELLTQKSERRARIGAVRGSGGVVTGKPVPPGVWAIDAGTSGTVCALDPAAISLWRADPTKAATLTLARGNVSAPVAFAAGQAVAAWPAGLPVGTGGDYRVTGGAAPVALKVRTLATKPASVDALGAALIEIGCQSQFERLVTVTKVPDAPVP